MSTMRILAQQILDMGSTLEHRETGKPTISKWKLADRLAALVLVHESVTPAQMDAIGYMARSYIAAHALERTVTKSSIRGEHEDAAEELVELWRTARMNRHVPTPAGISAALELEIILDALPAAPARLSNPQVVAMMQCIRRLQANPAAPEEMLRLNTRLHDEDLPLIREWPHG